MKRRWIVLIAVVSVLICAVSVCFAAGVFDKKEPETPFDKYDPTTWYDENNRLSAKEAEEIKVGMTFEEVVGSFGKPNEEIGSGLVIMKWDLPHGEYLRVWFGADTEKADADGFVRFGDMIVTKTDVVKK